jgi:hypothetical protein
MEWAGGAIGARGRAAGESKDGASCRARANATGVRGERRVNGVCVHLEGSYGAAAGRRRGPEAGGHVPGLRVQRPLVPPPRLGSSQPQTCGPLPRPTNPPDVHSSAAGTAAPPAALPARGGRAGRRRQRRRALTARARPALRGASRPTTPGGRLHHQASRYPKRPSKPTPCAVPPDLWAVGMRCSRLPGPAGRQARPTQRRDRPRIGVRAAAGGGGEQQPGARRAAPPRRALRAGATRAAAARRPGARPRPLACDRRERRGGRP